MFLICPSPKSMRLSSNSVCIRYARTIRSGLGCVTLNSTSICETSLTATQERAHVVPGYWSRLLLLIKSTRQLCVGALVIPLGHAAQDVLVFDWPTISLRSPSPRFGPLCATIGCKHNAGILASALYFESVLSRSFPPDSTVHDLSPHT